MAGAYIRAKQFLRHSETVEKPVNTQRKHTEKTHRENTQRKHTDYAHTEG